MTRTRLTARGRRAAGFTLVELMVSAAVCVIIMTVLATCFQTGIDTMRQMRSVAKLQDRLRTATEVIRRDLKTDHFTVADYPYTAKLADLKQGTPGQALVGSPGVTTQVKGGFFRIEGQSSTAEGSDGDGIPVTRSGGTPPDHLLHFTSILSSAAATSGQPYTADSTAGGQLTSPAAEIAYLLDPVETGSTGGPNPIPTYKLVRRQRVVYVKPSDKAGFLAVAKNADQAVIALQPSSAGTPSSASGTPSNVFSMADLLTPANRLQKAPAGPIIGDEFLSAITDYYNNNNQIPGGPTFVGGGGVNRQGDEVLLSNVISFEVKVATTPDTTNTFPTNGDYPYDTVKPLTGSVYDSTTSTVRIKAIQVRIRVYDPALKSARQITIVQDM